MSFKLTILGSSGALPAYGRLPSSHYLQINNTHILIDCGEGTQLQLRKFQLPFQRLSHIFISHLHGDHYLGLMGLLFTLHLQRRTNDLHIYSQPGLDQIILLQLKYSNSSLNYKLVFHPITSDAPATICEDKTMTVETIPLLHKISCTGFLFKEKTKPKRIDKDKLPKGMLLEYIAKLKAGDDVIAENGDLLYKSEDYTLPPRPSLSYAYCSDTAYKEEISNQIKGVDLLYHEATFTQEHQDKAIETRHSTALEAARIASKANAKKLLIGHFSARYKTLEVLLEEAKAHFTNTHLAIEGETIDLRKP
ncbi:MAG: ribonuclease Z [Cyclobacteriaceae bacterium]